MGGRLRLKTGAPREHVVEDGRPGAEASPIVEAGGKGNAAPAQGLTREDCSCYVPSCESRALCRFEATSGDSASDGEAGLSPAFGLDDLGTDVGGAPEI